MKPLLEDLDRCEHGRHAKDNCCGCPGGQSTGNLFLLPGARIGTTLSGEAILAPPRGASNAKDKRMDSSATLA